MWEKLKKFINSDIEFCKREAIEHPLSKEGWEFAEHTDDEILKKMGILEQKHNIKEVE